MTTTRRRLLLALGLVALWLGWLEFWFLTDDAFITFRYAANRQAGLGYVWNAPPFRPVEGYSNFLWLVLLDGVWALLRLEPPDAANVLSLGFSALTLWRVVRWAEAAGAQPTWQVGLALTFLLGNRTFLTWSSSGLETAMFDFFVFAWFERLWRSPQQRRGGWALALTALLASAATLTRPDGALLWVATASLALLPRGEPSSRRATVGLLLALAPVPAHELWRLSVYGEWLPNTYYAKHVGPWPEMGARYLACFVVEYGVWALLLALPFALRRANGALRHPARWLALGALLAHTGYFVVRVGGDHFEYRVLAQWAPVLAVAWAWALVRVPERGGLRVVAVAAALAAVAPVQWVHYARSRGLVTRDQTWKLKVAIAPSLQWALGPVARWFDETQFELIEHHVGMRHQEHKVFAQTQRAAFPLRRVVAAGSAGRPTLPMGAVGVVGWALPNVDIIDWWGLNDPIIARTPVANDRFRLMAHDRTPPPGYLDCFRGNVVVSAEGVASALPRDTPLTDDDIVDCERRFSAPSPSSTTATPVAELR